MAGGVDVSNLRIPPEKHERATANYFASLGKDISFIKPSNIKDDHRPDILMDGIEWEVKCPQGSSKRTIERLYRTAAKQSKFIIFDLRRSSLNEANSIKQLEREFIDHKSKKLLVIKKNGQLIEFPN